MSGKSVQCWPGICSNRLLSKIDWSKIKIVLEWFQMALTRPFSCAMLSGASWTTLQRSLPVQCYPTSIKAILNRICSCTLLSWASVTTLDRIFTSAMLSQDYKTTLNTTFSCALLSWVSRTLLDRVFTCVTLSQEYFLRQHWTEVFSIHFFLEPPGEHIAQSFYLCNVVPRVLRQHWTEFFGVLVSWASRTTLHRVSTCAMLSQESFATLSGTSLTTLHNRFLPIPCCPKSIKTT